MRSSSRRAASLSLRLVEHSDSVTMAFSLTPSCFGKDPWHCRVAVSRQHLRQQQCAPTAAGTTKPMRAPTTSNMTSCARLTVATWPVRPSRWVCLDSRNQGGDHKPPRTHRRTPSSDNSSSTRAAARCSSSGPSRCHPWEQPSAGTLRARACLCLPADDPAASTAVAPHSWNLLVTRLGREVARWQYTRSPAVASVELRIRT